MSDSPLAGTNSLTGGNGSGPTPQPPQANAPATPPPPTKPSVGQRMVHGALAAVTAMAGPDASGKPRRGLAPILGGILAGSMTGLAAGANRERGEAGGGLAAMGRGYQARTGQLAQQQQQRRTQQQQATENQMAQDKLQLEKVANARALNASVMLGEHQDRMEKIAQETKDSELGRLAEEHQKTIDSYSNDLMKAGWEKVPDMSGFKTRDEAYEGALKRFPAYAKDEGFQLRVMRDPDSGLYEVLRPGGGQVQVDVPGYGKVYMGASEAGLMHTKDADGESKKLLEQYHLREAELGAEKAGLEVKKLKADADSSELEDAIVTGHMIPERWGYIIAKNPAFANQIAKDHPEINTAKLVGFITTYKDFTSGRAAGALNSVDALTEHLGELVGLNTIASRLPIGPDRQAFENKVNVAVHELGTFYANGNQASEPSLAGFRKTLDSVFYRQAAFTSQLHSMKDKLESYQRQWENAAPSPAYGANKPENLTHAIETVDRLLGQGGEKGAAKPQGATKKAPDAKGIMHWTNDAGSVDLGEVK